MNKRIAITAVACLALVALLAAGCSDGQGGYSTGSGSGSESGAGAGSNGDTAAPNTVVEKDTAFSPAQLEVKVGDTVTFTNEDSAPHNVSIDGTELGDQSQGESKTWDATKAGSFPYSCTIHPSMTGEIIVK